jgi:transcriptional regulator with XRE-family HTH domain
MAVKTVGERIRQRREQLGISLRRIVKEYKELYPNEKITFQVLSKWERNLSKIPAEQLPLLAALLQTTPGKLCPSLPKKSSNGHAEEE